MFEEQKESVSELADLLSLLLGLFTQITPVQLYLRSSASIYTVIIDCGYNSELSPVSHVCASVYSPYS